MGMSTKIQRGVATPKGAPKAPSIPKASPKNVTPKRKGDVGKGG